LITSLQRRRAGSGAPARGSREERRLITIRAALGPATSQNGGANNINAPLAAGVRSDSGADALDPDLTPITPAPDTPRGFSG